MPTPIRKIQRRGPIAPDDVEFIVTFFISAGSLYAGRPRRLKWLPFCNGKDLKEFWTEAERQVERRVDPRAFALMAAEFGPDGLGRQFEGWPSSVRREVYRLCEPTGCLYWIDDVGNVMPLCVRSMATYREDIRRHDEAE